MVGERRDAAQVGSSPGEVYGEGGLYAQLSRLDFIGQLLRGQPAKLRPVVESANLPAASVERRGTIAPLYVAGAADQLLICLLTAPGPPEVYEWVPITLGTP